MGYVFDPDKMQGIAKSAVRMPLEDLVKVIGDGLVTAYPDHIDTMQDWVYSLFGGTSAWIYGKLSFGQLLKGSLSASLLSFCGFCSGY